MSALTISTGRRYFGIHTSANTAALTGTYNQKMQAVRVLAILSVVWAHCYPHFGVGMIASPSLQLLQMALLQAGRVGTILFFLLSGYFISEKTGQFTSKQYLGYRLPTLIIPWLIFLSLVTVTELFQGTARPTLQLLLKLLGGNVFYAAYWFIPVSVLLTAFLILMKHQLDKWWFGVLLAIITLFYCLNLYTGWTSTNYVKDFAAYALFLWLGLQLKRHLAVVDAVIRWIPLHLWAFLFVTLFASACYETARLTWLGGDGTSNMRLSNELMTVTLFILLIRSGHGRWADRLQPQRYTFGVYLIHCLVILLSRPWCTAYLASVHRPAILLSANLLFFIWVIVSSFAASFFLNKTALRVLTGAPARKKAASAQEPVTYSVPEHKTAEAPLVIPPHYDRSILEFYACGNEQLIVNILALARKELGRRSAELELWLINDHRQQLQHTGRQIGNTAVAVGFLQLARLTELYDYVHELDVDHLDQLVQETLTELKQVWAFVPLKDSMHAD